MYSRWIWVIFNVQIQSKRGATNSSQFMTTVGYEEVQSFLTYGSYYS